MLTRLTSETADNQASSFREEFTKLMEKYNVYFEFDHVSLNIHLMPNASTEGSFLIQLGHESEVLGKIKDCTTSYK